MKGKRAISLVLVAGAAAALLWRRCASPTRESERRALDVSVRIVTYTVPFENYREHGGLVWLLNHLRVPSPRQDAEPGAPWESAVDYIGYRPTDRQDPMRISEADLGGVDLVYVADTYGVYRDDLRGIEDQRAHMDYSPLVFGGLTVADARHLARFAAGGGVLVAEFNSFATPTSEEARAIVEEVMGLAWSGWVGRVFVDPHDADAVPAWLPREFAAQHPDRELPHAPILLLVDDHGRLEIFSGESLENVAPTIELTEAGRAVIDGDDGAPYFYWFGVMRPGDGTEVLAELVLPDRPGLASLLDELDLGPRLPMLTRRSAGSGLSVYFAGDLADVDFDPGAYDSPDIIPQRAAAVQSAAGPSTAPSFWKIYAPAMIHILEDAAERRRASPGRPGGPNRADR